MIAVLLLLWGSECRIHEIRLMNEERSFFPISTFGFFEGGMLRLNIKNLTFPPSVNSSGRFMLSLVKHDGVKSFYQAQHLCHSNKSFPLHLLIEFDFEGLRVRIRREREDSVVVAPPGEANDSAIPRFAVPSRSWDWLPLRQREGSFAVDMLVYMGTGGEYSLYYHNCRESLVLCFVADLAEINEDSFLSAGEMPLPAIYATFTVLYLLAAVCWTVILRQGGLGPHFMMMAVVVLKTLSLFFLALNFFFVRTHGLNEPGLATVFYITYIMKGAFTVATIALIGAGWIFVKHILSPCDKRIFLLLIPLQILANVAYVVIEENQQFSRAFKAWKLVLLIVDLVCCAVLLFPFVHSIRLLQSSPKDDHKARANLAKLTLFRRFYFLVVCYLYLSRILVYFLNAVLPYQLFWLTVVLSELITLAFFIITAWCFLPARISRYVPLTDY